MDGITIVLDNKEFTATDANGNVVKPMIYNGTTYVPLRAVSTAFGKAVSWDAETKTAYLGDMDGKLEKPTAKLGDLENISSGRSGLREVKNIFDNYDNFYNDAVYSYYNQNDCCEVLLNNKYSTFKATLFIPEGTNWKDDISDFITIIGDGTPIFKSENMSKTSTFVDIEVNVTDINDFKIIFNKYEGIHIANAAFYQ